MFEHKYRYNSAAYIHEHMRLLRDSFGVHHVNFYDDLFTANRKRIHELCDLLIARPLGMNFNCAIRAGGDDIGMFRKLKAAGALVVSMGIESDDPVMMKRHKAGVTLDEVRAAVRDIHAAGLRGKGLFIFGLPGETPDTVRRTSAFIQALGLDEINISKFSPPHGAPIWDECISGESGRLHEDWRLMNCMNFVFQPSGFGSREEMDEHYNAAVKGFYTGKTYQRRFARRLWQHRFSLLHLARSLPTLLQAKRYYDSDRHSEGVGLRGFPLHPRQPLALPPVFSPGLLVGKKNAAAREAIVIRQAA